MIQTSKCLIFFPFMSDFQNNDSPLDSSKTRWLIDKIGRANKGKALYPQISRFWWAMFWVRENARGESFDSEEDAPLYTAS